MRIYKINIDYIKYLHSQDNRVQYSLKYTDAQNQNRPYIGPVLIKDGISYYAPLEHPRPAHTKLKESSYLVKIDSGKYGIIGINNMIPVPEHELIDFDISKDKNCKVLISQFVFCKKHARELISKANKVYAAQANPNTAHTQFSSCNFVKLKKLALKYPNQEHSQTLSQSTMINTPTYPQAPVLPNQIPGMGFTQSF